MRALLPGVVVLAIGGFPNRGFAPPPMMDDMRQFPGTSAGKASTYWIAPYVRASEEEAGQIRATTVTWYSKNGRERTRRVEGLQPGFAYARENGQEVLMGVNEDWEFVLPKRPNGNKFEFLAASEPLQCTQTSHVLLEQFPSPDVSQLTLNIFVNGKLANSVGPFVRHRAESFQLGADGASAGIIWKDATKTTAQIVITDPEGNLSARVDCQDSDQSPIPTPGGVGALLPAMGGSATDGFLTWYGRVGKGPSVQVSAYGCVGWVPDTQTSLFAEALGKLGDEFHYRMIDWKTGNQLWEIACPGNGHPLAVGITPQLVIFAVAELYRGGPWRGDQWVLDKDRTEWTRAFYAVGVKDGRLVANWRPHFASRLSNDYHQQFMRQGMKLYFVTAEEFVELSEDDILNAKGGWER